MDKPAFTGTLVVNEVGPFYSTLQLVRCGIPIPANAVAVRVKEGKRQPLCIYIHPDDGVLETLFLTCDSDQDLSRFKIVHTPEKCNINLSIQGDQAVFRLRNPKYSGGFHIVPTAEELARILKASWNFFSELDRTVDFPDITQHIQVEVFELQMWSQSSTMEQHSWRSALHVNGLFTLQQGSSYGLKLTNNSCYNLYPTVQYFNPTNEFGFDTWYKPPCARSRLDAPLKKDGGSFIIGYGLGGSPPLVIPSSDQEGFGFLKVSLFSRPLDPFYEAQSFRSARYVYDSFKGPWTTIIKPIISCLPETPRPNPSSQPPQEELVITQAATVTNSATYFYSLLHSWPTLLKLNPQTSSVKMPNVQCSIILNKDAKKSILSSATGLKLLHHCPVLLCLKIFLPDSKLGFHGQGMKQKYTLQPDGSEIKMSIVATCENSNIHIIGPYCTISDNLSRGVASDTVDKFLLSASLCGMGDTAKLLSNLVQDAGRLHSVECLKGNISPEQVAKDSVAGDID
ncbi:hypothetical protein GALMADRAFT_582760 [Galerina marginata CBS 339.88]|uniref:Uncharacterized protein n=1 Tax=Galerina marginata (strain CBS 339.88) TaxID=685588 RepID=A0A067SU39_GALM3|nr:hypothetical protein GALMADRAFT_582760 [Galerina marginata CBS 339.88]